MCGIVGWMGAGTGLAQVASVEAALAALAHRGPDDSGLFVFSPRDHIAELRDATGGITRLAAPAGDAASLVLGHRRLAIIDPSSAGHQPMCTPDGRFVLVLNGEIYNYIELRRELEALGVTFRSRSDTEVLLHAWARWGNACLPRLVGMFAFVVVDLVARRLTLARDPFGMKPLYYTATATGLVFASTIGALRPFLGPAPRVAPQRLYDYLAFGLTDDGDRTLLEDVRSIPAAHYLELDLADPTHRAAVCYWHPDPAAHLDTSFEDAAARLRELFLDSVRLHLRSDVRVGTLLSGGIDSSAIVMAMRHVAPNLEIHTFSYIGEDGAVNEEPWIDEVNRAAGAVSHKLRLRSDEWAADFGALVEAQDEPFGTIAVYAQNRLFRLARETGVRVVLDGQGGDELLGGYRSAWAARIASHLKGLRWAEALRFTRGVKRAPHDPGAVEIALQGFLLALPGAWKAAARRLTRRGRRPWIRDDWCRRHDIRMSAPVWSSAGRPDVLRAQLWHLVRVQNLPALLRFEDRNSMAHSVEARLPFLTTALAEFLLALPESHLVSGNGTGKAVFRAAMRDLVPRPVLARRDKIGFSVPIRAWIPRMPALPALLETLARVPAVDVAGARSLLTDRGPSGMDVLLGRGRERQGPSPFWVWFLAALAVWVDRVNPTFD